MNTSPDNQPSTSHWLSDSADPRVVDLATQMFLEGSDEAAIRREIGIRGVVGDQQDAVLANIRRQAGKQRASFDKQTANLRTGALASAGTGALALLLGLGLLFIAPVLPFGIMIVGMILLGRGARAYKRAGKRQFGPNP